MELHGGNNGLSWIISGDFNEVRALEDRQGQLPYNYGGHSEFMQSTDQAHKCKNSHHWGGGISRGIIILSGPS